MVISNEDIEKIKNFTKDVKDKLRLAIYSYYLIYLFQIII